MTDPRFRPRSYCVPPQNFGTLLPVKWDAPDELRSDALDQFGAAQWQHARAREIREALKADGLTVTEYAKSQGIDYTRLSRILRGDIIMRVEDMVNAERNLKLRQRRAEAMESPGER